MFAQKHSIVVWGSVVLLAAWLVGCSSNAARIQVSPTPTVPPSIDWSRATQPQIDQLAQRYLGTLSLDQRIGQLFMQGFSTIGYADDNAQIMRQIQPGGTIWYAFQMQSAQQTRDTMAATQQAANIPVLTASDNEGGVINNLRNMFPPLPSATAIGYRDDPAYAYAESRLTARDMLSVGLNTDLAPVVDVQTVAYGPDTSGRTYGFTPDQVTKLAGSALAGLQDTGVIGTLKHFPGLGSATTDAHTSLPIITKSRADIEASDFAPYRALLNGPHPPGMVMATDVLMTAIDSSLPAELSPTVMGILRNELHFDGVILTDALYMDGIRLHTGAYPGEDMYTAGVMALQAGCDMLNYSFDLPKSLQMRDTIKAALANGQLTMARINQSVQRILRLKIARGLIPFQPESVPGAPQPPLFSVAQAPLAKSPVLL